jgi:pyruvate dehydrogenase E2 component (dihydrolipoamide acetyltransferase)
MAAPIEVRVPDIGGFKDVSVIDVMVKAGQQIEKETPLVTIETEKAAMDVPAPSAGKIVEVKLKSGDKVSEGSLILMLEQAGEQQSPAAATAAATPAATPVAPAAASAAPPSDAAVSAGATATAPTVTAPAPAPAAAPAAPATAAPPKAAAASEPKTNATSAAPSSARPVIDEKAFSKAYASPSIRKFARELGADLGSIKGTGVKSRITQDDVKAYVKSKLTAPPAAPPKAAPPVSPLPKVPAVDFALFGPVEIKPLSRIQKISGARLQASWINLPHVTQHEDADITELEAARGALKGQASEQGVKLTPLAFIVRACVLALQEFPRFNASLDASGENLVFKKYFNIGFAADTPNGLVVPVIANADRLGIFEIARILADMSEKARAGKLKVADMQGGTFTISSLGGIGGTAFTPIINAPEVAILGVSKSSQKPVYERGGFVPRLMLPLSLSYDHRVIDGAAAARFAVFLAKVLGDPKVLQ